MKIHKLVAKGDLAGVLGEIAAGVAVDARDEQGFTPLMTGVTSPAAGLEVLQSLLEHGADVNALSEAQDSLHRGSVLFLAARQFNFPKIKLLVEAGADVKYVDKSGYSVLLSSLYGTFAAPEEDGLAVLEYLISARAPFDTASSYGESVVGVSSMMGHFKKLKLFLDRGANPELLQWTPLFFATCFGELRDVEILLDQGASLTDRDHRERTPFLLSIQAGRVDVAQLLLDRGSDRFAKGRCGSTAIMHALNCQDMSILHWLISEGFDFEETNEFNEFPLLQACQHGSVTSVRTLLEAGADAAGKDEYGHSLVQNTSSIEIIKLLLDAGGELSDVESAERPGLLGVSGDLESNASRDDYFQYKHRIFGRMNPDRMNNRFWEAMIRSRVSAYGATSTYGDPRDGQGAVWCGSRFGQSLTLLPDGRYVEIGGEHEDSYDEDFCIYNDVIVYSSSGGTFDIFGYPEDVFPPTDFHTATFLAPYIYVIGNLGYYPSRRPGETPVYRLDCKTWRVERIQCTGHAPGWIHRHRATLVSGRQIRITGGSIIAPDQAKVVENTGSYVLDLNCFRWEQDRP
jgi:ankyrin repeat protein